MTLLTSQGKVAIGEVDKSVSWSCQILSEFNVLKLLKSVNFWQSYWKIKRWTFFGGHGVQKYTLHVITEPIDQIEVQADHAGKVIECRNLVSNYWTLLTQRVRVQELH